VFSHRCLHLEVTLNPTGRFLSARELKVIIKCK